MAGYITYWPQDQIKVLQKEKDNGPIEVVFGSVHTKMPSIVRVKVGDCIYPVTIIKGILYVVARLPVERIEAAYDYLVRELGNRCGALVPEGMDKDAYWDTPLLPHKYHQQPFNCCSQHAATGTQGSTIELRPIDNDLVTEMLFGPSKSKERPLKLDKEGNPSFLSVSSVVRKMSDDTQKIFDSLFQ